MNRKQLLKKFAHKKLKNGYTSVFIGKSAIFYHDNETFLFSDRGHGYILFNIPRIFYYTFGANRSGKQTKPVIKISIC